MVSGKREAIYQALFDKATTVADFTTKARRMRDFSDIQAEEMPALYQVQVSETPVYKAPNLPPIWHLHVELWIYVNRGGDPDAVPSTVLNAILDTLETTLQPAPNEGNRQTLGGLASHCYINGKVELDEGVLGTTALAIVPIEILTT